MARLTDDLLLLASGDAGRLSVQLRPVAPDTLCIELYDQFYPLARQSGHTLTLELPEQGVPAVQADAERLKQLLAVLLHNALEHSHSLRLTGKMRRDKEQLSDLCSQDFESYEE